MIKNSCYTTLMTCRIHIKKLGVVVPVFYPTLLQQYERQKNGLEACEGRAAVEITRETTASERTWKGKSDSREVVL